MNACLYIFRKVFAAIQGHRQGLFEDQRSRLYCLSVQTCEGRNQSRSSVYCCMMMCSIQAPCKPVRNKHLSLPQTWVCLQGQLQSRMFEMEIRPFRQYLSAATTMSQTKVAVVSFRDTELSVPSLHLESARTSLSVTGGFIQQGNLIPSPFPFLLFMSEFNLCTCHT